jgi:hypothetical protein
MTKTLMYIAMFVGTVVIALWLSRDLNYFLSNILYWLRSNWLILIGIGVAVAIGYKFTK